MNRKTAMEYLRKNQPHGHHKSLEEAVDVALADMEAMSSRAPDTAPTGEKRTAHNWEIYSDCVLSCTGKYISGACTKCPSYTRDTSPTGNDPTDRNWISGPPPMNDEYYWCMAQDANSKSVREYQPVALCHTGEGWQSPDGFYWEEPIMHIPSPLPAPPKEKQ